MQAIGNFCHGTLDCQVHRVMYGGLVEWIRRGPLFDALSNPSGRRFIDLPLFFLLHANSQH